ncbi:uncharacterized protein LOC115242700 [Formica exsecta]|uniref:uncharacterized protein LOC115242700 n=1 Tax=Formica exsecta TaxID=72781 RepID=UPI00114458B6|nr:uncharacterized protein LOC115242700 [Formica exsecta]
MSTGSNGDPERPRPASAETTQDEPTASADAISRLKLPPFSRADPRCWFAQIEMAFELERIVSDDRKFKKLAMSLDSSVTPLVRDLIMRPPREERYETLKTRVLNACCDSAEDDVRRLLRGLSIGDDKPSNLLSRMRNLAGEPSDTRMLRELFLDRLPENVQDILACNDTTDLSKLAMQADRIMARKGPHVSAIEGKSTETALVSCAKHQPEKGRDALIMEVAELRRIIEEMNTDDRRNRSRSKTPQRRRTHSRSRTHTPAGRKSKDRICFYHRRFAHEARNCIPPCEFVQKPENVNDSRQ